MKQIDGCTIECLDCPLKSCDPSDYEAGCYQAVQNDFTDDNKNFYQSIEELEAAQETIDANYYQFDTD
jgi:hypothetical protein